MSVNIDPRQRRFEKIWNTYMRIALPRSGGLAASYWATQVVGDRHGPNNYTALTDNSIVLIEEVAQRASNQQSLLLDVGCNAGRHLNALYQRGFKNLYGVDVQGAALDLMGKEFPEMKANSNVTQATFQDYLPKVEDGFFEVVFTVGATIELVPPSFPICQQMARIASSAVILVVDENNHSYPRLLETEFAWAGFALVKLLRPACFGVPDSLLVFQRMNQR